MSTRTDWRTAERIFMKFYAASEWKPDSIYQLRLKPDKNNGHFTWPSTGALWAHDHCRNTVHTRVGNWFETKRETRSLCSKHLFTVMSFETSEQQKLFILSQHHKKRTYQTCYGMRIRPMFILYIKQLLSAYCGKKKKKNSKRRKGTQIDIRKKIRSTNKIWQSMLSQTVTFTICIRDAPGSSLDHDYISRGISLFSSVPLCKCRNILKFGHNRFLRITFNTSFTIIRSLLDTTHSCH